MEKIVSVQYFDKNLFIRSNLDNSMLGVLISLFEKYLVRRLRLTPAEVGTKEVEALGLIVAMLAANVVKSVEDFDPNDLFLLLEYVLQYPDWGKKSIPFLIKSNYGSYVVDALFKRGRCAQVCYIGEFIYYCATLENHPASPVKELYMQSTNALETTLITEIGEKCSAELGISLFSVLRNYFIACYNPVYQELVTYGCVRVENGIGFPACYDHYISSLAQIEIFPDLLEYFNKFITFLRSNFGLACWHFSDTLLQSENLQNAFRHKPSFLLISGNDRYMVKLLQFFLDMLCFLRSQYGPDGLTLSHFQKLPEFFKYRWRKCSYVSSSIYSYIFEEVALILDFLLFSNILEDYHDEYYNLCKATNDLLIQFFGLTPTVTKGLQKLALYPYLGIA